MKDYYQILNLNINASKDEIKKAYRLYASKFHPDKQSGDKFFEERFKEIKEAYDVLIDNSRREIYNRSFSIYKNSFNHNYSNSDNQKEQFLREKEQKLKLKEDELKRKEEEIIKAIKVNGDIRIKEQEKHNIEEQVEELRKKIKYYNLQEDAVLNKAREQEIQARKIHEEKIYLKKGNVIITGSKVIVGETIHRLEFIDYVDMVLLSKKKYRVWGWILLLIALFTFMYLVGFIFSGIGLYLIFKRDQYSIFANFNQSFKLICTSKDRNFTNEIVLKINEAIYDNKINV